MNSRERGQRAVNFQSVDRRSIDCGGMQAARIAVDACLLWHLRISPTPWIDDLWLMIASV